MKFRMILLAFVAATEIAIASDPIVRSPVTRKIEQYLNDLSEKTGTKVTVCQRAEKGGTGYSDLVIFALSPKPINGEKLAWFKLLSAMAVGKVLNDQPSFLSDTTIIGSASQCFTLSTATAKKIQGRLIKEEIDTAEALAEIEKESTEISLGADTAKPKVR